MSIEVLVQKNGSSEFTCTVCGTQVFRAVAHPGQKPICAVCEWVDRVASDPEERERLRAHLNHSVVYPENAERQPSAWHEVMRAAGLTPCGTPPERR